MDKLEDQAKQVAARIRQFREAKHFSQLDLAALSGVSQNMITYIETGRRAPTLTTLLKLCNALGINPSALFQPDDQAKTDAKAEMHRLVDLYF